MTEKVFFFFFDERKGRKVLCFATPKTTETHCSPTAYLIAAFVLLEEKASNATPRVHVAFDARREKALGVLRQTTEFLSHEANQTKLLVVASKAQQLSTSSKTKVNSMIGF